MTNRTIALFGNPNSGKTTLFNLLTASNMKVGNRSGVTVEAQFGRLQKNKSVVVVDTPGARTVLGGSSDEQVTADFLASKNFDVAVCVVDACNPVGGLLLAKQICQTGVCPIVALNMWDEAQKGGVKIDLRQLEKLTKLKFFAISAKRNVGVEELIKYCIGVSPQKPAPPQAHLPKVTKLIADCFFIPQNLNAKSDRIDKIVLNKFAALPIFAIVMLGVFYLASGKYCGGSLTSGIENFTPQLIAAAKSICQNCPKWLCGLICDGIIGGVMSVVGFLPQVIILYTCISVLEDVGYMARVAVIFDGVLQKIGLGGKSAVSLLLGTGCSVTAIYAARIADTSTERKRTAALCPFVPCSAKLAVVSAIGARVFDGNALFALCIYALCVAAIIFWGYVFRTFEKCNDELFINELPPYRLPSAKSVTRQIAERAKDFLSKAGSTVFAASLAVWLTSSFDFALNFVPSEQSILATVGKLIAPIMTPIGFDADGFGWQFTVATMSGLSAKESILSALQILLPPDAEISKVSAFCFVAYNMLTLPCVATVAACFAETGKSNALKALAIQTVTAYVVCLTIYQTSKHPKFCIGVILASAIATALLIVRKSRCRHDCSRCAADCKSNPTNCKNV